MSLTNPNTPISEQDLNVITPIKETSEVEIKQPEQANEDEEIEFL